MVYHLKEDREELNTIFINSEEFDKLDAEYVVLLVKDRILGFVTIGAPVSNRKYDKTLFELIESITSSIYISITNALLFDKIKKQTEVINKKYNTLKSINHVIKNINSCDDINELTKITMRNLELGYGVQRGFITLFIDNKFKSFGHINLPEITTDNIAISSELMDLACEETFYEFNGNNVSNYLPTLNLNENSEANCLVAAPIRIDNSSMDNKGVLGYIIIIETQEALKQEEILLIDTMANSIAPVVRQMEVSNYIKDHYKIDDKSLLLEKVKAKLVSREEYYVDFKIFYKEIQKSPFREIDLGDYENFDYNYFDNYVFLATELEVDESLFDGYLIISDLEDFYEQVSEL